MTHALLRCMLRDEVMVRVVGSDEMGCGESNWCLVFKYIPRVHIELCCMFEYILYCMQVMLLWVYVIVVLQMDRRCGGYLAMVMVVVVVNAACMGLLLLYCCCCCCCSPSCVLSFSPHATTGEAVVHQEKMM